MSKINAANQKADSRCSATPFAISLDSRGGRASQGEETPLGSLPVSLQPQPSFTHGLSWEARLVSRVEDLRSVDHDQHVARKRLRSPSTHPVEGNLALSSGIFRVADVRRIPHVRFVSLPRKI